MLVRGSLLLPIVLSAQGASAYFAQVNNAHVEFAASGTASGAVVDAIDAVTSLETSLEGIELVQTSGLTTSKIVELFEEWIEKHGMQYESLEGKASRMLIWLKNHVMIETHNAKTPKPSFTMGHNSYSDMTHDEFRERFRLGEFTPELIDNRKEGEFKFAPFDEKKEEEVNNSRLRGPSDSEAQIERRRLSDESTAASHDWADIGVVGPIRNQGICGACWAFSAIGAIESVMAIEKYNKLPQEKQDEMASKLSLGEDLGLVVPLSEQNLIDCDTKFEHGCKGGLMTTTFQEEEVKKGICSETDYPYHQGQGTCSADMCTPVAGSIVKDKVDIVPRKTNALKEALTKAPVTAAMVASDPMFQFYHSGIYSAENCGKVTQKMGTEDCKMLYEGQDTCLPDINHGVLVVGYGTDETSDSDVKGYFKVKNSWGDQWGEDGFFRLARFEEDKEDPMGNWGECAILTLLSYPVMA